MRKVLFGWALLAVTMGISFAQAGAPIEKFQPTDIFVTYYRGPSVADPAASHNSKAGRDFESELQSDDDERFCLQAPQLSRSFGMWKNDLEPSYWIHANARPSEAEAYAAEHAKAHQQDAVMLFEAAPAGPDSEYVFSWETAPSTAVVFDAVQKAGFDGATMSSARLILVDAKSVKKAAAATLAQTLGAKLQAIRGNLRLLDQGGYEKALTAYDAFPHPCPWKP